jgi:hypothetical protein
MNIHVIITPKKEYKIFRIGFGTKVEVIIITSKFFFHNFLKLQNVYFFKKIINSMDLILQAVFFFDMEHTYSIKPRLNHRSPDG